MNIQLLTIGVLLLCSSTITAEFDPVEKGGSSKADSAAIRIFGPGESPVLHEGPEGPAGDAGPQGVTGPRGPMGPAGTRDHQFATVYIPSHIPLSQRQVPSTTGTLTVPFSEMGIHSDKISFNPTTHKLSLPSGVYTLSFECMLYIAHSARYLKVDKLYLLIHAASGPPSSISIHRIHSDYRNSTAPIKSSIAYAAKTLFTIPDNQEYTISLVMHKYGTGVWYFYDPDIPILPHNPTAGHGNPAHMSIVKIAEYQPKDS